MLGVFLFLFMLTPGLAYVLRRERAVPEAHRSAFRETIQVVTASVVSLFVTGLLFAGARAIWPTRTLNIRGLIQAPEKFFVGHHVQVGWWAVAYLAAASLFAWLAADPRLAKSRVAKQLAKSRIVRLAVGPPAPITPTSAWYVAAHAFDGDEPGLIQVGAQLDDGTYVIGYLDHFNIDTGETADRDILLHGPLGLVTTDGQKHNLESTFTVISARRIVRVDFTHLAPSVRPAPVFAPVAPAPAVPDVPTLAREGGKLIRWVCRR
ncbi:DUF6338 family protein [Micromonospora sp. NPDC049051]|uniref:DUF6338 family protein n=1 Tax=Micromonospora sp. NPDC049051 TaxID=3364264 RepID=UPI0037209E03